MLTTRPRCLVEVRWKWKRSLASGHSRVAELGLVLNNIKTKIIFSGLRHVGKVQTADILMLLKDPSSGWVVCGFRMYRCGFIDCVMRLYSNLWPVGCLEIHILTALLVKLCSPQRLSYIRIPVGISDFKNCTWSTSSLQFTVIAQRTNIWERNIESIWK
jgi:hypothetical protein